MSQELVSPNWHVVLIHFPIALLSLGLVLELLSCWWTVANFRTLGRGMIVAGIVFAIPAAAVGAYAFRDAVLPGPAEPRLINWFLVVQESPWTHGQWEQMRWHVWFNSGAVAILAVLLLIWTASTDGGWRKLYAAWLLLLAVAVGLLMIGAWHGGEAVYVHGTAVHRPEAPSFPPAAANAMKWYLPPLQLHILLAAFAITLCLASVGLMMRPTHQTPANDAAERQRCAARCWLWLGVAILALLAASSGIWYAMGTFSREQFQANLRMVQGWDHLRLSLHLALGASIPLLAVLLGALARFGLGSRLQALLIVILLAIVGVQIWLGLLLLYDSHEGPLTRFASEAPRPWD